MLHLKTNDQVSRIIDEAARRAHALYPVGTVIYVQFRPNWKMDRCRIAGAWNGQFRAVSLDTGKQHNFYPSIHPHCVDTSAEVGEAAVDDEPTCFDVSHYSARGNKVIKHLLNGKGTVVCRCMNEARAAELAKNLNVALPKTQDFWRKHPSLAGTSIDVGEGDDADAE